MYCAHAAVDDALKGAVGCKQNAKRNDARYYTDYFCSVQDSMSSDNSANGSLMKQCGIILWCSFFFF